MANSSPRRVGVITAVRLAVAMAIFLWPISAWPQDAAKSDPNTPVSPEGQARKNFADEIRRKVEKKMYPGTTVPLSVEGPDATYWVWHISSGQADEPKCKSEYDKGYASRLRKLGFTKLVVTDESGGRCELDPVTRDVFVTSAPPSVVRQHPVVAQASTAPAAGENAGGSSAVSAAEPAKPNLPPQPRAFILDMATRSVIVLAPEDAAILGTVSFEEGILKTMIQVPHSKRLAVFDQGLGKDTFRFGWHPEGKASISFVDMDSMKITSHLQLGWGIGQVLTTDDGKGLAVVCPGYTSQKPEETLPGEVVLINTETAQIAGRFPVKTPVNLLLTPDNRTLITFTSAWHYKDRSRTPEVQFADFETGKMLGKLVPSKAVTSAELSTDGQYLYLLDPGQPSDKFEKNVDGFLVVVSVPNRSELSAIDVGSAPQGLIHDNATDHVLILSDTAPVKKHREPGGFLSVFKGTEAVAVTPVAYSPLLLRASPDGTVLYVVGPDTVSVLDSSNFRSIAEIHIEGAEGRSYRRGGGNELNEFTITPDGKRGIAIFSNSFKLTILDLEQRKSLASLKTGRGSVRFLQAMSVGLDNFNAQQSAQATANETGVTQYYTIKTLKPTNLSLAVSPDSKFAYALNDQTSDVTVIDAQAATVLSKIPIRGLEFEIMPGGNTMAILGPSEIQFIDLKTNQKMKVGKENTLKVGGLGSFLRAFRVSPSGTRACALGTSRVICLDTSTIKEVGRQEHFKYLETILFEEQ